MRGEIVAALLDPVAQAMPLREQRLVGDLHGGGARRGVPVEREQSIARERVDGALERHHVDVEGGELGGGNPPRPTASPEIVAMRKNSCRTACCSGPSRLL